MKNNRVFVLFAIIIAALVMCGCNDTPGDNDTPDNNENLPNQPDPDENLSDQCILTSFKLESRLNTNVYPTVNFAFDNSSSTYSAIYIKWIEGDNPDKLVASFDFTGAKVLVNGVEQTSTVTVNSFAEDLIYTVVAEDGTRKDYTVSLACPQINTEVPVLALQMNGAIGNDYIKSKLDMYGAGYTTGLWTSSDDEVEIRLRGNSTRGLPKHPYRIKFPEKFSPLGLNHAQEKSWTLLANDCDKTLLRNVIAFGWSRVLFKKSDHDNNAIMFTPASRQVNLFLNKQYVGLYQMSDHMERADGRIELESLKAADEGNAAKITGGYLLETDVHGSSEPFHFISGKGIKITHKYPADDDHATEQYTYVKNHLNMAENVLFGSNFKDPVNGWRKYWDEKTAVDFMIVKELTWDPDGFTSIYFYKRRGDDRFFFGPIWDFDKAYNNDKRRLNLYSDLMIHKSFSTDWGQKHWHARMWEDETFRSAVKARWNAKKAELLAASTKILQEEPEKMAKSIKANFTRWNITEQALTDAATPPANYKQGLDWLQHYVQSRYEFLDAEFNKAD